MNEILVRGLELCLQYSCITSSRNLVYPQAKQVWATVAYVIEIGPALTWLTWLRQCLASTVLCWWATNNVVSVDRSISQSVSQSVNETDLLAYKSSEDRAQKRSPH